MLAHYTKTCPRCGNEFVTTKKEKLYCKVTCTGRLELERRFWEYVDTSAGQNACWPWKGPIGKNGYGVIGYKNDTIYAHRLALELHKRGPLVTGAHVCHKCDNRPCCNWRHLWEGTNAENHQDKMRKGRQPKGENSPKAKLNSNQVRDIRRLYSTGQYSYAKLGKLFGLDHSSIYLIVKRKNWRHIV